MPKRRPDPPPLEPREFRSLDEIDSGIAKLERRIRDLEQLDVVAAVRDDTGADDVVRSNVRESIREVFGAKSPEFNEHQHIRLWAGSMHVGMDPHEIVGGTERGRRQVIGILNGLIGRLREKREELGGAGAAPAPSTYFERLNLHPRILDVSRDLFLERVPLGSGLRGRAGELRQGALRPP